MERQKMDALAGYDSDEDNYDKNEYEKEDRKSSSKIAGDNYDNVQMDLSEESSSGSSSKAGGGTSKYSSGRDIEDKYANYRSERTRDERHIESRRDYRKGDNKRTEEQRKRRYSLEKREHGRHSSEKDRNRRSSDDREKRGSSVEKDRRGGNYHSRYRPDERHGKSSRRSKSPSSRRRSQSRERYTHKRRERSRSPLAKKPESSSSPVDKGESPPAMTNEQFLASITLAQKLAQQVQPPKATATSISGLPGLIGNPSVTKIQEQLQKRRMLWQQAKPEAKEIAGQSNNNWEGALLPKDDDGKMTAKFKRLMGIKGAVPDATASSTATTTTAAAPNAQEQLKKQDDMFNNMERQYEVARLATHTHRGLGLGFGAFQCNPR